MASPAAPSLRDQALHLLQEAALADRETKLVLLNSFHQILRRDSSLLPVLFTPALDFAADRLADARKWAAAFAEEAMLSTLPEDLRVAFLSQSLDRLARLISDESVAVVKRTVVCLANIYPFTFQRIATHPENSNLWDGLVMLKTKALQLLQSSDNEGIKTAVTKFMQVIVLVQSRGQDGDVSVRLCKPGHPVLQSVTLEEEGNATLEALMALIHAELLSSSTITAIISAIGPMLKTRVQHLHRVLYAFRNWTKNSPRTLTATQTKSIERTIKNQLTALLKSTALSAHAPTILEALGDISPDTAAMLSRQLGRSYQQQRPSDPSVDDKRRKRPADMDNSNNNLSIDSNSKRPKVADIIQSTIRASAPPNVPAPSSVGIHPPFNPPTDVTKIPLPAVVEVVLRTLMSVPVEMLNMAISHHRNNPAFIAALMGQPSSGPLTSAPDRTVREGGTFSDDAAATPPTSQPGYPPLSSTASDLLSQMLPGLKPLNQTGPPSMSNASTSAPVRSTASTANAFRIKKVSLKPAIPLSPSSCRNLAASTIRRVIQAGSALGNAAAVVRARADSVPQTPTVAQPNSTPKGVHPSTAGLGAAKDGWMVVLSRLMTRAGAVDGVDRRGTRSSAPASSAATPSGEVKVKQEEDDGNGTLDTEMCEQELIPHDGPCADDYREAMVEYIQEDFKNRHELAVVWLYEELYQDMKAFKETMTATPRYFKWLLRILDAVMPRTESKDRTFIKFLLDVPALDDAAVNRIRRYCDDPDSLLLGLSALRDLVLFRPPVRDMGLDVILSYCLHKRKVTRSTAIVTVKKWVPDHLEISERVEQFALQSLRRLQGPPEDQPADAVVDDVKQEETKDEKVGAAEWNELDVIRNLELFFALCTKKHELLGELFAVYPSTSQTVQRSVRKFVYPLIKSIGQGSAKLIHVIQEFPEGAEMLALRVLSIFTETARPSPQLVSVVSELFVRRNLHARFLIPIVAGLKKEEILKYLPRLVGLLDNTENERKVVKDVFLRLIDNPDVSSTPNNQPPTSAGTPPASDKAPSAAPLSPAELMVALHNIEETVGLKRAVEATQICFGLPEIFKAEVLAVVLQQMVDQPKLPTLFMRTVIQSVNLHKSLAGFVNGLLSRLITKKVWTAPKLWEGFMRCCRVTAPGSFTVLLQLPKPQLSEVLTKVPSLCKPLAEHVQNLPAPQRERIQNSVPVLKPVVGIKIETDSSMGD